MDIGFPQDHWCRCWFNCGKQTTVSPTFPRLLWHSPTFPGEWSPFTPNVQPVTLCFCLLHEKSQSNWNKKFSSNTTAKWQAINRYFLFITYFKTVKITKWMRDTFQQKLSVHSKSQLVATQNKPYFSNYNYSHSLKLI